MFIKHFELFVLTPNEVAMPKTNDANAYYDSYINWMAETLWSPANRTIHYKTRSAGRVYYEIYLIIRKLELPSAGVIMGLAVVIIRST